MHTNHFKPILKVAARAFAILSFATAAYGQTINLTAGPSTAAMPDGTPVPMWGYTCGAPITGSTAGSTATCTALNPAVQAFNTATTTAAAAVGSMWSPVVITVPAAAAGTATSLTINLTNNLSFPVGSTTPTATIPTSIVIVGQVGGGLGTQRTTTLSPDHTLAQGCPSWFIAANPPGTPCTAANSAASGVTTNTPPVQANRVQSFSTEVAAGGATAVALNWPALKPGTYLLESGTHPSIQVPMGLIGVLVVTTAPAGTTAGTAYPGAAATATTAAIPAVQYNAELPLEFSEIDPVQNNAVNTAVNTAGFSETRVWSGLPVDPQGHPGCGNPASGASYNTCYPPAVNYTPFYYLINGVAINKTNAGGSLFAATAGADTTGLPVTTGISGTVLARLVNAGLRMHVPSIVGSLTQGFNGAGAAATVSGFTLIAEDGNPLPGVQVAGASNVPAAPRVQTDVFMAAGKVFDVMINAPAAGSTAPALPIFDRELSLSGNSSDRDAGMVAYVGVNGAGLPVAAGTGVFAAAVARPDTYDSLVAGQPFSVSDTSRGVIANDTNVYGAQLLAAPSHGTLTCNAQPQHPVAGICANGTFTYTPTGTATSDSFTYCANGTVTAGACSSAISATVTLGASTLAANPPTAIAQTYTAQASTYIKISSPGLLIGNSDPNNLPLSVVVPTTPPAGVVVDAKGGFTASVTSGTTVTFPYTVQNSQGRTATGTVTVNFPAPSNLSVTVVDAQAYSNCQGNATCISGLTPITDYRWIIEEDKTFWVDPNCTTNNSVATPGCPSVVPGPAGQTTVPTFGTNFHASHLDYVAQGCTGPLSCESGQTMLDTRTGSATFGAHIPAVCDLGNGACRPDPHCTALPCLTGGGGTTAVMPSSVRLDPTKRYYISVLPGDAANPFPGNTSPPDCSAGPISGSGTSATLNTACGHTMSGAQIAAACNIFTTGCTPTSTAAFAPVTIKVLPTPLPTAKLTAFVFEDDFPLNGEQDGGGGNGTIAPIEPGLGGFEIILWDTFGGLGDFTGQDTHDMFNQPLSNSLAGTIDPATGLDACPIATQVTSNVLTGDGSQAGITGRIVTCPKYESDNVTLSPLAGQAVIANLMPDKFSVQAYPGADRIARGEEWLQTNTLDGQHPHDAFLRIGEPGYFTEFGPSGYHVSIGFANPAIINARYKDVCAGAYGAVGPCTNIIQGQVDVQRVSRTPDQRLYPSGSRDALIWSQCWVSLGDPDAEDFMFTKCDANGNFKFTKVPGGNWRLTIGDQWNDQIIDGLSTPANVGCVPAAGKTTCSGGLSTLNLGNIGVQQWQSNIYTRLFVDDNKNGIPDPDEIGVPQVYTRIKYRDGHNANTLLTDPSGVANFNETFPLFNWYVVEPDLGRYKRTGTHTVYDAGGPADGSGGCAASARPCGTSTDYHFLANTYESLPLPADLHVPGAVYCATADCKAEAAGFAAGTASTTAVTNSTGRLDPPWVNSEGWSGLTSHGNWIEFGVAPYAACDPAQAASATNFCATVTTTAPGATTPTTRQVGENGGIHGHTTYAATRPFDDASQMIEQPWSPNVPGVTLNLYQEGVAADGVTPTLTMVDTTVSTSWDAWAQGFYPGSTAGSGTGAGQKPYMSCPGQGTATGTNADPFFFSLLGQPEYLDWYNSLHNGGTLHTLPYNSQYKCYDSMHIGDQTQPAPYDGYYQFPSSLGVNATAGTPLTNNGSTNGVASNMAGTNCTVCVANPDTTDHYRVGTPMLPPGKYVVEVIMPPGYEVYKEEDKNLLIGDNFIAPATVQFPGLGGSVFIMPDQASVASMYEPTGAGYNGTNYQNQTTGLGTNEQLALPGYPGFQDPIWPCVGEMRVVPDYLSLFPQNLETAPFAGATRPLCDRKEVTLGDQMSVSVKFYIFTSAHIAAKFTGVITDDLTSEFDPFSPQFGEKFSPPNMPVATKDYLGNELSRVYADHWGTYESVNFSTWDVNPPNITGYAPSMMVQCMNDAGPIQDTRATIPDPNNPGSSITNPTFGQMIPDPLYDPAYSQFCYEEPYMPGLTTYLDTPVVPTQAFVGAAYNNPDCAYPDTTPAIAEVDGDGIGPWVSATGARKLTITALGNVQVGNSGYAGPSANTAPFSLKKVQRHYGFGAAPGSVMIGTYSVPAASITTWTDASIVLTIPSGASVPACAIQQQAQYMGSAAQCGQLLISTANTAAAGQPSNSKQSIDSVTVTIGGKGPTHVAASQTIQSAIDAAAPGDLLIIDPLVAATATTPAQPAVHQEMLLMWKPVRLQGVGAVASVINANAQPAGKLLDPWRRHVNCLFGLTLSGIPRLGLASGTTAPPYDSTGTYSCPDTGWQNYAADAQGTPQIDRLPLEAVVGWDAIVNGNLAEQLQEPSLMGAYEGAGITVLGKGVWTSPGETIWTDGTEGGAFPADALLLQDVPAMPDDEGAALGPQYSYCFDTAATGSTTTELNPNPYPSNFECNPSSIDGLTVTNSSQGGGGIFVHGWAHNLQIANDRVYNNAGTLSGGISVGQGEFPIALTVVDQEATSGVTAPIGAFVPDNPPSCLWVPVIGVHLPYCLDVHVNVHNNFVTNNASLGDELFSGTLSGGGGATFCTGSDYYKFNNNWVCGNLSAGEGGGVVHLGFIYNGDIEHNSILLNQSSNPTIPTNGGGIMVQGTPDTDPICGALIDQDCPPGLSDGTGPGLVINANLIQGNSADSGAGGGIRMNQVNGTDVSTFPNGCVRSGAGALITTRTTCPTGTTPASTYWNSVSITNNIINNNMAGWDGGGISLQDSLNVSILNNTIAHNDSLASSGVLTFALGTPEASAPAGECTVTGPTGANTASCPQVAGVASTRNSALLTTSFTGLGAITCPTGQTPATGCRTESNPILGNNILWQNRSFQIGISGGGTGSLNQQNLVTLYNAKFTTGGGVGGVAPAQNATGQCATTGSSYWDIGVRGDTGPTNHTGGTLTPTYSMLSSGGYGGTNTTAAPPVVTQYCNGARVPPECSVTDGCGGPSGFGVPPGINDAVTPNPRFSLTPAATVDEGNNWINVSWGPLALTNPALNSGTTGNYGSGPLLANYNLTAAIDTVPASQPHPLTDFYGNARPEPGESTTSGTFDPGAIEFGSGPPVALLSVTGGPVAFGNVAEGYASTAHTLTLNNTGTLAGTGITLAFSSTVFTRPAGTAGGTCTATLAAGATCTINVVFTPTTLGTSTGTLTITASVAVAGSPVSLSGTGVAPVIAATLTPTTWTVSHARNCPGTGIGVLACLLDPAQAFTLTNTGNVPLTGITSGALGGTAANDANYAVVALLSTCGPAAGQLVNDTTLNPGATCSIEVQFRPLTAQAAGAKPATISVTDAAGTQTSTLNGTAQ